MMIAVFILMTAVTLINTLIAMLGSTYESVKETSISYYWLSKVA